MKLNSVASRQEKMIFARQLKEQLDRLFDHGHSGKSDRVRVLRKKLSRIEKNL